MCEREKTTTMDRRVGVRLLTDPVFRGRLAHLRRVAAPADAAPLSLGAGT